MSNRFQDKSVFITGASSGIGAEVGKAFAREGAKVALTARRADKLDAVCAEIREAGGTAIALAADVTDRASLDDAVAKTIEEFGGIDVVVANAGFSVVGTMSRLTTDDFRRQFDTNVFGVVDTLYATLEALKESKGRIAVVSSMAGRVAVPRTPMYNASKYAVNGLCESMYHELDDLGISLTLVSPGFVETEIHKVDNRGVFKPERKIIVPKALLMQADTAARIMVNAIYKRKPEVIVTTHAKIGMFIGRHFPRTVRTLSRIGTRGNFRPKKTA